MRGYLRADGRKGIRNTVVVAYLVECAHHVAREIAAPFREHDVHLIGFAGCYPNAYAETMMRRLCTHPNVGAALLVSLGCESFNRNRLAQAIRASGRPAQTIVIQAERRHAQIHRRGSRLRRRTAQSPRCDGGGPHAGERTRRRHRLRRLRRDISGITAQSRPSAARSTVWSRKAPPASSRRRAN